MGTFMSLMGRSPGAQGGPRVNAEVAPERHQVGSQPLYAPDADINISWLWTPHSSNFQISSPTFPCLLPLTQTHTYLSSSAPVF